MRAYVSWALLGAALCSVGILGARQQAPKSETANRRARVPGMTQPVPERHAAIAPTALAEIREIYTGLGEHVQKGQLLIRLADDDAQTERREAVAKRAECEAQLKQLHAQPFQQEVNEARADAEKAATATVSAGRHLMRLTDLAKRGAVADRDFQKARQEYAEAQKSEQAAAAKLDKLLHEPRYLQMAELEAKVRGAAAAVDRGEAHCRDTKMRTPIAGVVVEWCAHLGMVARPGTAVWGEVVDPSELDVRCLVSTVQADHLRVGQNATIFFRDDFSVTGRVVGISIAADRSSGKLPVLVRFTNPDNRCRCYASVEVSFTKE